ncbi:endonuclease I [Psychromonas sp. CNPT3]|uniref:endonuclease n=1 Tax=Psychromonas sp. CNPT3 TaxID=314282 RepID=UPI00006E426B|nr:endonuclease [Psychromonas sp. CNPT3]AGH82138.1 endonuclease I [Psychromonas sp. CNPT3]
MFYKYKQFFCLCSVFFIFSCQPEIDFSPTTKNLLVNSGFENWPNNTLAYWSTTDKGLTFTQEHSIYRNGSSSAKISILSTEQRDSDFRQSIDVKRGESYKLSVWVYHTQGYSKARIFIDGYQNYSNNNLIHQWQELTFNYHATATKRINIGLRFYAQVGFKSGENVYVDDFTLIQTSHSYINNTSTENTQSVASAEVLDAYYKEAKYKTSFSLKTALYNIIKNHQVRTYSDVWSFISANSRDIYYDKDHSILDMYSENPSSSDSYYFDPEDKCGKSQVEAEGNCYNREHSFPKSWFGGEISPMYTDIHPLFATDGYVNSRRSRFPYGETNYPTWTSKNGSKLGQANASTNYNGIVFEPIDEFKGDFARAYFYMATRYENVISTWKGKDTIGSAVLDGSKNRVFQPWVITLLKRWHANDPVSLKERQRNKAAFDYQGNRNPYIDHPEYVTEIW